MSEVSTKLVWNGGLKFTGKSESGSETAIDGDRQTAATPMELLLEAVGACAAVDVVMILQKMRAHLTRLEVHLEGERHRPEPRYYTAMQVRFDVWGEALSPEKVARAINLSFTKYCSVYHSLRADLKLQAEFRIHTSGVEAAAPYQLVEMAAKGE